jgi:hypothetical protein
MIGTLCRLENYALYPFWSMVQEDWFRYVRGLRDDQRHVLSVYPFRWAYVPPHDPQTAVAFLRDIGVDRDQVQPEDVEVQAQKLPSFNELLDQGMVTWANGGYDPDAPAGFRMIPEWEPMAGVLYNWLVFYPPLWEMFGQIMGALDHVTILTRGGGGIYCSTKEIPEIP